MQARYLLGLPNETCPNTIDLVGDCVGIKVNFDDCKRRCHLK
jgi:hypothetical protein